MTQYCIVYTHIELLLYNQSLTSTYPTHSHTLYYSCVQRLCSSKSDITLISSHVTVTPGWVEHCCDFGWPSPCSVGCRQCSSVSGVEGGWWPCEGLPSHHVHPLELLSSSASCIVEKGTRYDTKTYTMHSTQ